MTKHYDKIREKEAWKNAVPLFLWSGAKSEYSEFSRFYILQYSFKFT